MDRQHNLPLASRVDVLELAHVNVGTTIGLSYLGVAISSLLYGITCCQAFNYYRSRGSANDSWFYKGMVAVLCALDTIHQVLILYAFYYYLILNFDNPIALLEMFWPVPASFIANSILGGIVHTYLIYRLWILGKNRWVVVVCGVWLGVSMGMDLAYPIRQFSFKWVMDAEIKLKTHGIAALCVVVSKDTFVAGLLSFYLYKKRGGPRNDNMITNLIILTICTGALTACFELANLIAYILAPESLFDLFFNMMLGKLYANSFLTILNTRKVIKSSGKSDEAVVNSAVRRAGLGDDVFVKSHPDELVADLNKPKSHATTTNGTVSVVVFTRAEEDDESIAPRSIYEMNASDRV